MSDETETQTKENAAENAAETEVKDQALKLDGLYAFKVGMSAVYGDNGESIPVTVLKYEPMTVSQVKREETDGYQAVQVACKPKRATRTNKAEKGHLAKAGFENGAAHIGEIRQALPENVEVGKKVSIDSLVLRGAALPAA